MRELALNYNFTIDFPLHIDNMVVVQKTDSTVRFLEEYAGLFMIAFLHNLQKNDVCYQAFVIKMTRNQARKGLRKSV